MEKFHVFLNSLELIQSKMKLKITAVLISTLILFACGPKNLEFDPSKQTDSQIYQQGEKLLEEEDYVKAREAFRVVFDNFPQSDYRILAKLGYANSYYLEGDASSFILAATEYQDFISLFPFSPKAAYAQFQIGMCYFQMAEKPDRDQTNTRKALEELRKVVDNYPNSDYYKPAYEKLIETYSLLAEHEYYIARYYSRTGKPKAVIERLKGLIKDLPRNRIQAGVLSITSQKPRLIWLIRMMAANMWMSFLQNGLQPNIQKRPRKRSPFCARGSLFLPTPRKRNRRKVTSESSSPSPEQQIICLMAVTSASGIPSTALLQASLDKCNTCCDSVMRRDNSSV